MSKIAKNKIFSIGLGKLGLIFSHILCDNGFNVYGYDNNPNIEKNFIKIFTEKLYNWTGERWIISLNKKIGGKTIYEKQNDIKKSKINEAKNNKKIKTLLEAFDDASLIDVEQDGDK